MSSNSIRVISNSNKEQTFMQNLLRAIKALEIMIESDMLESNAQRIGAEQELCFVDEYWHPAPVIQPVLEELKDEMLNSTLR